MKTTRTDVSVDDFLASVPDESRRADAIAVREVMRKVTGDPGAMWGESIVGFGEATLRYATGREVEWFVVGFSPRKTSTTLYLGEDFPGKHDLLTGLGPHTTGKGCVYVKRLDVLDPATLERLVAAAVTR
ncbi:DUF1801 domain-containing protein [Cryptosporangium phraense]|uniref:DUF1801 domain-containing protein n=1 Tax=Cryptosporangium phraense TaxID=2593070 RepID=A0A545AXD9_9ACTN|nr:DUF1801 domain-containing protein [Cryptosporangium phraense]TQS46003.1 DUF1801 domain-containing protein [Cryptosporangium phraense]